MHSYINLHSYAHIYTHGTYFHSVHRRSERDVNLTAHLQELWSPDIVTKPSHLEEDDGASVHLHNYCDVHEQYNDNDDNDPYDGYTYTDTAAVQAVSSIQNDNIDDNGNDDVHHHGHNHEVDDDDVMMHHMYDQQNHVYDHTAATDDGDGNNNDGGVYVPPVTSPAPPRAQISPLPLTPTRRSMVSKVPGVRRRSTSSYSSSSSSSSESDDSDEDGNDHVSHDSQHPNLTACTDDPNHDHSMIQQPVSEDDREDDEEDDYESTSTARFMAIQKRMLAMRSLRPMPSYSSNKNANTDPSCNMNDTTTTSRHGHGQHGHDSSSTNDKTDNEVNKRSSDISSVSDDSGGATAVTLALDIDVNDDEPEVNNKTPVAIGGMYHTNTTYVHLHT